MPDSPAITALLFGLRGCLVEAASSQPPQPAPGALQTLDWLNRLQVPCAWVDELSSSDAEHLASPLPTWLKAQHCAQAPWPAPDACWQALMTLKTHTLEGCVLISSEPRLLQSGLNAGLWTIGLARYGLHAASLSQQHQERLRAKATLQLFALGVHSVIDHFDALDDCLTDIGQRRLKGEKP
ncbi:phosphonoacetaldehyde phosphonohydrolase-related protein [Pseudomonas sp. H9]|uniref:phosphonoacetaldehyde phosphonohydrolase-related protein n=1 Tax=Pseudomonas sp. H9 TaxID=483968 RepID=UPI00105793E6|nr:phosphonoacetaldehyde phosphonohydrolase-related protein [Pseudomonas sp. H9]TDF84814.1 phosphonoacetaldehyde phosphonohydrolase-related protein [Pseudomonas sp. H9]